MTSFIKDPSGNSYFIENYDIPLKDIVTELGFDWELCNVVTAGDIVNWNDKPELDTEYELEFDTKILIKRRIEEIKIQFNIPDDEVPLIWASRWGQGHVVDLLIQAGASINEKCNNGETALMRASYHGHDKVIKQLIQAGASVNERNKNGETALMWASGRGYVQVLNILLKSGAFINERSKHGMTALMAARFTGRHRVINTLLKASHKQN